ncbi:MAG: hypothetical protein ABIJ03_01065 [Patescibacteria group bacterium]|nr:hypothetical protein [Patescibacteria group bacterium]
MLLVFLLLILPILGMTVGFIFYRFQGKKDLFKIDLVQFYYTFILSPIVFVWIKTMIFLLLQANAHQLSVKEIYAVDTAFSVIFLLIFAFVAMHSVTKTFHLKNKDPLYDIFFDNEYIHLWLSHIVMAVGSLSILTAISFINLWLPLNWMVDNGIFIFFLTVAFFVGWAIYMAFELADPKLQKRVSFMRLMKLIIGVVLSLHIILFAIMTPSLSSQYALFWFMTMAFFGASLLGFSTYKSIRFKSWINSLVNNKLIYKNLGWGENIALFDHHQSSEEKNK